MSFDSEKPPRQLPLDLAHSVGQSRDDLVVGPSNSAALALVESWPQWPSPVVVLAGPPGSGKTHLAAIWREESGATDLTGSYATTHAIEAASRGAVLIDDIDSSPVDETALFHLINAVKQAGTTLLLTARRFPLAWGVRLPDLESRLKTAAMVEIHEPDDMLLTAVLMKLFADRQVEVDPQVVQYLARRIERSLSSANVVVSRLDRAALEQKTRISRTLAAQIIADMDAGQGSLDM